jgi:hypothetical protein
MEFGIGISHKCSRGSDQQEAGRCGFEPSPKPSVPAVGPSRDTCYSAHSTAEIKNQWSHVFIFPVCLMA